MDTDISQTVIHEIYLTGVWSHTYRPVASIMKGGIWALENWRISAGCCRSICVWPEIKPAWVELISLGGAWVTWAATEALLTRYRLGEDEANSRTSIVVQSLSSAPQKKKCKFWTCDWKHSCLWCNTKASIIICRRFWDLIWTANQKVEIVHKMRIRLNEIMRWQK